MMKSNTGYAWQNKPIHPGMKICIARTADVIGTMVTTPDDWDNGTWEEIMVVNAGSFLYSWGGIIPEQPLTPIGGVVIDALA